MRVAVGRRSAGPILRVTFFRGHDERAPPFQRDHFGGTCLSGPLFHDGRSIAFRGHDKRAPPEGPFRRDLLVRSAFP